MNFQMKSRSTKGKGKQKNFSIHETFYYPKEESHDNKEFLYGNKKIVNEDMEYNDHIVFAELRTGDFLGGKSFLTP